MAPLQVVQMRKRQIFTTSIDVAEKFKKHHKHVLAKIKKLDCSKSFTGTNFRPSEYTDSTGRTLSLYPSVTSVNNYADRVRSISSDPLILYFGDMDVDGMEIPKTFMRSLIDEHSIHNVEVIRCGLNPDQVSDLQADPVGIKGSKQQKKNFISECGDKAYELDAVPPKELEQLVYDSLMEHTDMEVLEADKVTGRKTKYKFDDLQELVEDFAVETAQEMGLFV